MATAKKRKAASRRIIQNKVSEYRGKADITQEELASAVGVTRQTIIALEKGDYTPSVSLAMRISQHFKKRVEEMFWFEA